jgi:anaerobic selenocysteine-containing dehydrogenase
MHVVPSRGAIAVTGNHKFPVNEGGLCAKGGRPQTRCGIRIACSRHSRATATTRSRTVGWDEALDRVASAFRTHP